MKTKTKYESVAYTITYTFTVREVIQALLDKYEIADGEGRVEFVCKGDAGRAEPEQDVVNIILKSSVK